MGKNLELSFNEELSNKIINSNYKIIITGANGWIGKALLEALKNCFGDKTSEFVIPISSSAKNINLHKNFNIKCYTIDEALNLPESKYILFHLAFLTKDKVANLSLEEYIEKNLKIRNQATDLIKILKPKAMVYTSSGAVYNKDRSIASEVDKNPYGYLKAEDEKYFKKLAKDSGIDLLIPRIFNIAGPYMNKLNLYALSDFIIQATTTGKINIKANQPVIRSYIHLLDLFTLCFSWILDKKKKEKFFLFDTVGEKPVELDELAKIIISTLSLDGVKIIRDYNPNLEINRYIGDGSQQNMLMEKYGIKLLNYKKLIIDTYEYVNRIIQNSQI